MQRRNYSSILLLDVKPKITFCCGSLKERRWKEKQLFFCLYSFLFLESFSGRQLQGSCLEGRGLWKAYFFAKSNYFDIDSFWYQRCTATLGFYIKTKSDFMLSWDLFVIIKNIIIKKRCYLTMKLKIKISQLHNFISNGIAVHL